MVEILAPKLAPELFKPGRYQFTQKCLGSNSVLKYLLAQT
jgi:hypothetical protein